MGLYIPEALEGHPEILDEFLGIVANEANRYAAEIPEDVLTDSLRENYALFGTSCMVRVFLSGMNLEEVREIFKKHIRENPDKVKVKAILCKKELL